ncbi:MAG: hypothetical protein U0996_22655 [Planctomycetaceae bacterium]
MGDRSQQKVFANPSPWFEVRCCAADNAVKDSVVDLARDPATLVDDGNSGEFDDRALKRNSGEFHYGVLRRNSGEFYYSAAGGRIKALFLLMLCLTQCMAVGLADETTSQPLRWQSVSSLSATQVNSETIAEPSESFERFRILNPGAPEVVRIEAAIPASMLHNDFVARVSTDATATGAQLSLVILLPHHRDPRTGKPLTVLLPGESITEAETNQQLKVSVSKKAVETLLRRTRTELNQSDIQSRDAVIIGLAMTMEATPGENWIDIGRAEWGPSISPQASLQETIRQVSRKEDTREPERNFVAMDVELGAVMLDKRAVILRLLPDHSEHVETLKQLGINAVWVPDYQATDRARQLWLSGLAVLATPPRLDIDPGDPRRVLSSLPPLERQCPNVSAWYEGTRVPPSEFPILLQWSREVRSADRVLQRLQMADVTAAEGAAAREIDLVGMGRHVVGREESFGVLRNLLLQRQKAAGQLSFPWTWIQVEPSATQMQWRQNGLLPFVEPEQIHHQVYAALSAGYRGLGFWKTRQLQIDNPADRETSLAIELACMEVDLLEPFLARGRREGYLALQTDASKPKNNNRKGNASFAASFSGTEAGVTVTGLEGPREHDAAVISGNNATLILGTAWDSFSQYVPGPMFEREVSLIVAASETASAWQISSSGIRSLPREVTAGGLSLRIRNFDQSAAIVVTSDPGVIRTLEQKIHGMAERSASKHNELAELKYLRVLNTIETLREEHEIPPGSDALMASARQMLDRAQFELKTKDYHESTLLARDAMRNLRQVQQLCWKDAIAELTSPTASPHTISFQTLPEHWRLMHYLDQQSFRMTENLLPSGNFEDRRTILQAGWSRDAADKSIFAATADIISDGRTGKMLRLAAWHSDPSARTGSRDDVTPLVVSSPPVDVEAGDVVIVRGRVRRGRAVSAASTRPLMIFDSELGPECSMRTELDSEWTPFEMTRPIARSGQFRLSFGLTGQSEVHLDDLSIQKVPALHSSNVVPAGMTEESPN